LGFRDGFIELAESAASIHRRGLRRRPERRETAKARPKLEEHVRQVIARLLNASGVV
jgi:hypothetical protein